MFDPHRQTLMQIEARSAKEAVASQMVKNDDILEYIAKNNTDTFPRKVHHKNVRNSPKKSRLLTM